MQLFDALAVLERSYRQIGKLADVPLGIRGERERGRENWFCHGNLRADFCVTFCKAVELAMVAVMGPNDLFKMNFIWGLSGGED